MSARPEEVDALKSPDQHKIRFEFDGEVMIVKVCLLHMVVKCLRAKCDGVAIISCLFCHGHLNVVHISPA